MIPTYVHRMRIVKSVNQINAVHIGLERLITPDELIYLWQVGVVEDRLWKAAAELNPAFEGDDFRKAVRLWLETNKYFHDLSGKRYVEPYLRRELGRTLTLFHGPGDRAAKSLLLVFNGVANAPMMPPVTMLQALDARRVDVAMLKDIPFRGFREGMADIGDSLASVMEALPRLLEFGAYRRVCALGISGGGLASLYMAQRLGMQSVVLCGSRGPEDERWDRGDGVSIGQWIAEGLRLNPRLRCTIVYGHAHARDERSAQGLGRALGVVPLEVQGQEEKIDHNVLFPQLVAGSLGTFLADTLGY